MEYEDPLAHISFSDPRWLSSGFAITAQNVMEYFTLSGFYDRMCNNEVCKMQGISAAALTDSLKNMTGIEYALLESQEPFLYIIRKQQRESPTSVIPLATYYCLNGIVYQSPSVLSVACSRILNALYYIQTAMKEVKERVSFAPTSGYAWDMESTAAGIASKNDPLRKVQTNKELEKKNEQGTIVNRSLRAVAQKFPVSSSAANLKVESPSTPLARGTTTQAASAAAATTTPATSAAAAAAAGAAAAFAAANAAAVANASASAISTTTATLVPSVRQPKAPAVTITAPPPPLPTTITAVPPLMQLQLPDSVSSPVPNPVAMIPASTNTGLLTASAAAPKKKRKGDADEVPATNAAAAAASDTRKKKKGGK